MNKFNTKGGRATTSVWSTPHMTKQAKVKCVGKISLADLQDRTPRYKRGKRKACAPQHVLPNEIKRWAKHNGVKTRTNGRGELIIKLS